MISKNSTQLPLLPPQLPSPQGQETTIDSGARSGSKPMPSNNRGLVTNPVPGKSLVYESRTVKSKHSRRKANRKRLSPLWFGLYFPQLDFSRLDISMDGRSSSNDNDSMRAPMEGILEEREKRAQQLCRLADLVQAVSSAITIHPPHSLVFEIRSSLKYFGGIDAIRRLLKKQLTSELLSQDLPPGYYQAVSPTPSASLLLAKSGLNLAIYQKENLRSALGPLSIGLLPIDKEPRKQLTNMGIRNLRDIWRLPTAGLTQRFGRGFVKTLDYTLGKAPELLPKCEPLPHFSTRHDLSYEIEDVQLLLVIVHELITELCLFLLQKELCSSEIFCRLIHEQQTDTVITLTLRRGVRSQDHFMMLFETYLNDLELVAPVLAVEINTDRFEPYTSHSGNLLQHNNLIGDNLSNNETAAHSDGDIDLLVEQLQAKLGHKNIKNIHMVEEHCPEYAHYLSNSDKLANSNKRHNKVPAANKNHSSVSNSLAKNPRPFWLLSKPELLIQKNKKLYYRSPIRILSGPERIETRWWSGSDIRRDYYVGVNKQGLRLWIYHEKDTSRQWYLHGLFA